MTLQLQFTRNGKDTGDVFVPATNQRTKKTANDVHLEFEVDENKHVKLNFNDKNGKQLDSVTAPDNAKDVGIEFHTASDGTVTFRQYHWTDDKGKPIDGIDGYKSPPEGTHEVHLDVEGKIVDGGYWTYNGRDRFEGEIGHPGIVQPKDVNDAHLVPAPQSPALVTHEQTQVPSAEGLAIVLPLADLKSVLRPFLGETKIVEQD